MARGKLAFETIAPELEFLRRIGEAAKRKGKNQLTMRQIDAEIRAARQDKRLKHSSQTISTGRSKSCSN